MASALLYLSITILFSSISIDAFTSARPQRCKSLFMSSEAVSGPIPMTDEGEIQRAFHHLTRLWSYMNDTNALQLHILHNKDDEDLEWVEEEFETLTERDFYNTEWKIGTLMDNKPRDPKSIDTTWVRLSTTEEGTSPFHYALFASDLCVSSLLSSSPGTNKATWGDGSKGKWTVDVPSQYFSISKETFGGFFGKKIWAGNIDDFYYLEGTVRGWSPIRYVVSLLLVCS